MSIDTYSNPHPSVHHFYQPPWSFISSWSHRVVAAVALTVLMLIAETLYRRLPLRCQSHLKEDSDGMEECSIDTNGYRNFIKAEMERLQREENERWRSENGKSDIPGIRRGYIHWTSPQPQTPRGTEVSPPDWRSHPNLFRTPCTRPQTVTGLRFRPALPTTSTQEFPMVNRNGIRFYSPTTSLLDQPPTSRHEIVRMMPTKPAKRTPSTNRNFNSHNPTTSYKPALATPAPTPVTPIRRVKTECSPNILFKSPLISPSSSSRGSDDTASSESTLPTSPSEYHPLALAQSPPRVPCPGDLVLRRRPSSSIIPSTVDETDLWDGPFLVLNSTLQNWVELLLPEGSETPSWTAIADIMVAPGKQAKDAEAIVEIGKDGKEQYFIDKLRGVRYAKKRGKTQKEYLVHWRGWGCEDDTWEPEKGLPKEFIEDFGKKEKEWEKRKRTWSILSSTE